MRAVPRPALIALVLFSVSPARARPPGGSATPGSSIGALERACRGGDLDACYDAGYTLDRDTDPPRPERAATFYQRGCDGGHALSCTALGFLHERARGVERDVVTARALYERGCDLGDALGCSNFGHFLSRGIGGPADVQRAVDLFDFACQDGQMLACNNLGSMYEEGDVDGEPDLATAAALYRYACDGGEGMGCGNLGVFFDRGIFVRRDPERAIVLYERGCADRDGLSCNNLGLAYEAGDLVEYDPGQAATYYRHACDEDEAWGCFNLARLALGGVGGGDRDGAVELLERACGLGNGRACMSRGELAGGPTRIAAYENACELGEEVACFLLGRAYQLGEDVEQDPARARRWFRRACRDGFLAGYKPRPRR